MATNKTIKSVVLFILFLNFLFLAYSAYPNLVYTQSSFPSGQVDINVQASSGLKVSLYVNGNYVGQKDSIAAQKDVYLTSDIVDQNIAIGQALRFVNNNSLRTYPLNFTTGTFQSLSFGESVIFRSYKEEFVDYTDMSDGVTNTITVRDELTSVNFTNIASSFLNDGNNNISFVYYSILNNTKLGEKSSNVNYDKYSNKITASSVNITNSREIRVNGTVTNSNAPLFFVLNNNGVIGNLGQLNQITLNGSSFSIFVSNLKEGNNTIRFISVDPVNNQIFNGEKKLDVFVDTIAPSIQITSSTYTAQINGKSQTLNADLTTESFINGNSLKLNITTDATELTTIFNNQNKSYVVKNNSVSFDLSLVKGKNNFTLIATDVAGNIAKEAHAINFDNEAITLKNITPKSGTTVHFFIQDFEGFVNKGDVEITAFAIPRNAKVWDPKTNSDRPVSCSEYEFMGIRDLGQIRTTTTYADSQYNPDDLQISLTSIISSKITTKSSSDGKFKIENMILHDETFDSGDAYNLNRTTNPTINKVNSLNTICFVMTDRYGNVVSRDTTITLDSGNTMWRAGEITTMPNTIYAAEIEQTGNQKSGTGKVRFGVIAKLQYIGDGKLTNVNGVRVSTDGAINTESKNARIVDSEMRFSANPETNEMIIYFPVEVSPMNKKPLEYPSELKFYFKANFNYNLNNKAIPIDTANPVYFWTTVNVEKPLDHSKWLTPEMIDNTLAFLNKSIAFTKKATDVMGIASVGGVLTCTGAKFWHGYQMAELVSTEKDPTEFQKKKAELDRQLYMICDRVACTTAPSECSKLGDGNGLSKFTNATSSTGTLKRELLEEGGNLDFKNPTSGLVTGELKDLTLLGKCTTDDGKDGVYVSGTLLKYEKETSSLTGAVADIKTSSSVRKTCVPATYELDKTGKADPNKLKSLDLNSVGSSCYSPGAPKFDDTRCNIGGLTFGAFENPLSGRSSSSSIIDSVACGCVTDTYSHLKNWLKVQEGIQKCLMQAKLGNTKGSYCERLMSQAVCDIATNVVLPEIERQIKPGSPGTEGADRNPAANFLTQMRTTDREMNNRYSGTFLSQAGLSTDQLVNKACVAAITGDWSVLTDNILTAIDKNEVEPVFGPPFPESRLQGYNPITGTISINYRFTYGVISGGQPIQTTVELICDKNEHNGEYCPDDGIVISTQVPNAEFKTKTLSVPRGGSVQDTIVINENTARFWYNKLRFTHVYTIKGETKTRKEEFTIVHKSESLLANCYFTAGVMGAGAGFTCDSIFGEDALISSFQIDKEKTKIVPGSVLYPGNKLYLDLAYSSRNSKQVDGEDISLAYMAICGNNNKNPVYLGGGMGSTNAPYKVQLSTGTPTSSNAILDLYTIPQFTDTSSGSSVSLITTKQVLFNKKYRYAIQFADPKGLGTDLPITKVSLRGTNGDVIAENLQQTYITQNMNVNNANAKPNTQYLQLNSEILDGKAGVIIIEFAAPVTGISISIGKYSEELAANGVDKIIKYNLDAQFGNDNTVLAPGSCKLKLRVLPTSQVDQLTRENFDTFSSTSKNFTNVNTNDLISLDFTIQATPTSGINSERFDVVGVNDGSYICLNMDGTSIADSQTKILTYIYQNALANDPSGISLFYSLSANSYGTLSKETKSSSDVDNPLGLCGEIPIKIDLSGKEAMKKQLNDAATQSTGSEWIFGTSSSIEGRLSYTVTSNKKDKDGKDLPQITLTKKDIKVYFVASQNCNQLGIDTSKLECKKMRNGE